jgi:putative tricarboxylic transport membrane protein
MVVLLILNLPFAMVWAKLLLIPRPYLYAGITVFCALGIYGTSGSTFDLLLLLGVGILGFLMRALDFPLAPLIIGMVLGPLAETSLRDAAMSANGDFSVLVQGPISITLYALLAAVIVFSIRNRIVTRRRARSSTLEAREVEPMSR